MHTRLPLFISFSPSLFPHPSHRGHRLVVTVVHFHPNSYPPLRCPRLQCASFGESLDANERSPRLLGVLITTWCVLVRARTTSSKGRDGGSFWISYKDGVYDITDFISQHPGGRYIGQAAGGKCNHGGWAQRLAVVGNLLEGHLWGCNGVYSTVYRLCYVLRLRKTRHSWRA